MAPAFHASANNSQIFEMRKQLQLIFCAALATLLLMTGTFMASAQMPGTAPTNLVKMPGFTQGYEPLAEGILA